MVAENMQRSKTHLGVQLSRKLDKVEGKQNVERERADRVEESGTVVEDVFPAIWQKMQREATAAPAIDGLYASLRESFC
ncbi:hypothetical protein ACLB2K_067205 [Fragaria x ananassa]